MNVPHDNHSQTEERFDELMRDVAASAPTDAQWTAAHGRLRRRLAAESSITPHSALRIPHFFLWRMLAYGFGAVAAIAIVAIPFFLMSSGQPAMAADMTTPGQLIVLGPNGAPAGICPLEHTDVQADIAGFITRVNVKQTFSNPFDTPIEAVYEFPLPNGSAVDEMTMHIGARTIVGVVKEKQEARQIYNQARARGQRAALLEQQRPNIFTQSVANIQPGERIEIEIGYNEVLDYTDGRFEFVFPMVVAPRYEPRSGVNADGTVPDGPPATVKYQEMNTSSPVTRSGHDISVTVSIAAGGMQINDLASKLHAVDIERPGFNKAVVKLRNRGEIPNRDFVLDYTMTSDEIGDSLFVCDDPRGRFFTLILAPPKRVTPKDVVARELIFVIDQSGSMGGWKIEKAKLAMRRCIQSLNPGDTFNLLSFSGGIGRCFDQPVPATNKNITAAMAYLDNMNAGGGTEMMPAILEALTKQKASDAARIVGFMSDGQVGNDFEILSAVKQNAGTTRVFTFGVGDSINRFLIENMAKTARGEAQFVTETDTPEAAADRFYVSLNAPVLTDVKLDWEGIEVEDVTPPLLPDLFDRKPVMIHGRFKKGSPTSGTLTLSGMTAAGPMRRTIKIPAEAAPTTNPALPSLWARSRVEQIMIENPVEIQSGQFSPATREKILGLGLEYHLMTQFTSFVAVEQNPYAPKKEPVKVNVPAAKPQGEPNEAFAGEDPDGPSPESMSGVTGGATNRTQNWAEKPEKVTYYWDPRDAVQGSGSSGKKLANSRKRELMAAPAEGIVHYYSQDAGLRYDPTNGTNSYGDVYRFEGGANGPSGAPNTQPSAASTSDRIQMNPIIIGQSGSFVYSPPNNSPSKPGTGVGGNQPAVTPAPKSGGMAVISELPDIVIGDPEDPNAANVFVYPDAINLDARVSDETSAKQLAWFYSESDLGAMTSGTVSVDNLVSPKDKVPAELLKLDPALRAIAADGKSTSTQPVLVIVVLRDRSAETMKALAGIGFKIDPELDRNMAAVAIGRLPANRLIELARLPKVIAIKLYRRPVQKK